MFLPLLLFALQAQNSLPKDAAGWYTLGLKYAQAGDFELAEPAFAEACRLDRRYPDACYSLGRVRYLLNRFAEAIGPLEQSLANGEPAGRATLALAQAREGLDQAAPAEALFRKAISLSATDAELRYAMFLLRQGRVEESVAMALKAVERTPRSALALTELARAELQAHQIASAQAHLEQALKIDPKFGQAHLLLSRVYHRLGDPEKAARHLKAATAVRP
ncbi:MAG: tetratricopeptide repeat protein [Bryobacteraceae bacterium]|nr:tetratricopeptide repeat protein [Bryobacteraceae bacterium]MDW8379693.1 tetratricopeptide repeat protein [Bryobacterales bacterium]